MNPITAFRMIAIMITQASIMSPTKYAATAAMNNSPIKISINCSMNNLKGLLGFFSSISLNPYLCCLCVTSSSAKPFAEVLYSDKILSFIYTPNM